MSAAASGAAAAAAAVARARRLEEETTGYSAADLAEGWEFKILRSATAGFRNPERLRGALDEEAKAGWVLVEKFDNSRLRLKRPASARANDRTLGCDPYRTTYGPSETVVAMMIMLGVIAAIAIVMGLIFLATKRP